MLRVLIDTNIIIPLEDSFSPVPSLTSEFICLGTRHCSILVHPMTLKDIANDRDDARRRIILSKIKKYSLLEAPPFPNPDFLTSLGRINTSPTVDDHLLYALKRDCVHLLVTEDKGIHAKARKIGLGSSVYNIEDSVALFRSLFELEETSASPFVQDVPLYQLNLSDSFFDSLREDYPQFDSWFKEKCKEGRHAWVVRSGDYIQGICIYKEEPGNEEGLCSGTILKMCTFKISDNARGEKIGELLLKTAFQYCRAKEYEGVYFTILPKHTGLIDFCEEFGFIDRGLKRGSASDYSEHIFYKTFYPPISEMSRNALDFHKAYWPCLLGNDSINKFIVPVRPSYHETLFPEVQDVIQRQLWVANLAVSNAIRKAYICKAKLQSINPGDLLLFYRSRDLQRITTLGIVENARWVHRVEDIISLVGKRTVFSVSDIEREFAQGALVILFREIEHLMKYPSPRDYGLPYPQRIQTVPHAVFLRIAELRRNQACLMV